MAYVCTCRLHPGLIVSGWVGWVWQYDIVGGYAQTELGHGSNIRGIETTATYLPESGEFDLHSPTLTSTKWWIGGLGQVRFGSRLAMWYTLPHVHTPMQTATHCAVFAKLILGGRDRGVHAFMVRVRSEKDHTPMPGVLVGDIGPKLGCVAAAIL